MPIINGRAGQSATIKQTDNAQGATLIQLTDIRFSYNGNAMALDGVTLRVRPGEFVCIAGCNGNGKSTLAKHLNALVSPQDGSVLVAGRTPASDQDVYAIRKDVAMVFQNPDDAIVASTVEDDVAFGPSNLGISPVELRTRVTESLEAVGLGGFEQRDVETLSGGQRQRLAIASALAMNPRVLVLDEATAMLDPAGRKSVMRLAKGLHQQGMTIVCITHRLEEALDADRLVILQKGRIVADGKPDEILSNEALLDQAGLEQPAAARLSSMLRAEGLSVPATGNPAILKEALCASNAMA